MGWRRLAFDLLDAGGDAVSTKRCVAFLDALITSWKIDLATFDLEIVVDHASPTTRVRRFAFVERVGRPARLPERVTHA